MGLSNYTRKEARSDLRSRLAKHTPGEEFSDGELNHWLNVAQFDVFTRLSAISDIWYGTTESITINAAAGAITAIPLTGNYGGEKIAKIIKLVLADGVTVIPFVTDLEIHSLIKNSNYNNSYAANHFGESLYIFVGENATALSSNTSKLYFIRKPNLMTADSGTGGTVDVPTEFYDLVIMAAMSKALFKLNMINEKQQIDADIASKFNDIRQMYSSEIQLLQAEKAPGTQTPRAR